MNAFKRIGLIALLLGTFAVSAAPQADAGIIFRGGPVRRVAARSVLPPYPVARRAAFGPVYRPYYRPYAVGYGYGPRFYGPGVSVGVGIY
jgi:hypothetical protein